MKSKQLDDSTTWAISFEWMGMYYLVVNREWKRVSTSRLRIFQYHPISFTPTCPVAKNMAATMFAACALFPPIDPASAAPIRFFTVFRRMMSATSHLRVEWRMRLGIWTSQETDLPRPSSQLAAEGFLSVQLIVKRNGSGWHIKKIVMQLDHFSNNRNYLFEDKTLTDCH